MMAGHIEYGDEDEGEEDETAEIGRDCELSLSLNDGCCQFSEGKEEEKISQYIIHAKPYTD